MKRLVLLERIVYEKLKSYIAYSLTKNLYHSNNQKFSQRMNSYLISTSSNRSSAEFRTCSNIFSHVQPIKEIGTFLLNNRNFQLVLHVVSGN